jgi:hypothetical protein
LVLPLVFCGHKLYAAHQRRRRIGVHPIPNQRHRVKLRACSGGAFFQLFQGNVIHGVTS